MLLTPYWYVRLSSSCAHLVNHHVPAEPAAFSRLAGLLVGRLLADALFRGAADLVHVPSAGGVAAISYYMEAGAGRKISRNRLLSLDGGSSQQLIRDERAP